MLKHAAVFCVKQIRSILLICTAAFFLLLLIYPSSAQDADLDGIVSSIDIDDDNDGILDVTEGLTGVTKWVTGGTTGGTGDHNPTLSIGAEVANITASVSGGAIFVTGSETDVLRFSENQSFDGEFTITFDRPVYYFRLFLSSIYRDTTTEVRVGNFTLTLSDGTVVSNADFTIDNSAGSFSTLGATGDLEKITDAGTFYARYDDIGDASSQKQGRGFIEITALANGAGLSSISFEKISTLALDYSALVGVEGALGRDSDSDNIADFVDLDSDNDGIPDNIEAQTTAGYTPPNGLYDASGVDTAYAGGLTPIDTQADGTDDFLDLDTDNDGADDATESGFTLTGVYGTNGLDSGAESADDYTDPNGQAYGSGVFTLLDADADTLINGSNASPPAIDFSYRDNDEGAPSLLITKTADITVNAILGQIITYTYTIANNGNQPISNITLNDTHNGTGSPPVPDVDTAVLTDVAPVGDSNNVVTGSNSWDLLAAGDILTVTATYTVTQQDIDTLQ